MYLDTLMLYIVISLSTAALTKISVKLKGNMHIMISLLIVLIPAIFAGVRVGIGTDYYFTYEPYFQTIEHGIQFRTQMELGYWLINYIVVFLGGNFQWVLFISEAITIYFVYKTFTYFKKDVDVGLGMFIFMLMYYFTSFNYVRQVLAMAVVFYSLRYLKTKNFKKYCIWIILAALFHNSAILALGFYPLLNVFKQKKHKIIALAVYVFSFLIILNVQVVYDIMCSIDFSYSSYFQSSTNKRDSFGVIFRRVPLLVYGLYMHKYLRKNPFMYGLFHIGCIGVIFEMLAYVTVFPAERLAMYFWMPYCCICMTYLFTQRSKTKYAVLLFIGIVWYYEIFIMGYHQVVPYMSIWSS